MTESLNGFIRDHSLGLAEHSNYVANLKSVQHSFPKTFQKKANLAKAWDAKERA